jgi:hypothetical protein
MTHQFFKVVLLGCTLAIASNVQALQNPQAHIEGYKQQGATHIDIQNGQRLFTSKLGDRSCTSCHTNDLTAMGKHQKTGKPIKPMALSVNPKRFQDDKKIEKWFMRNCKWTFKRECTVQEKADILSWLASQ